MKTLLRIGAFALSMGAAIFLMWFGLEYYGVIEQWISTTCIVLAVVLAILAVTAAPYIGSEPQVAEIAVHELDAEPLKRLRLKVIGNIVCFIALAAFSYYSIKFGIEVRDIWEAWISTTIIIFGAVTAVVSFSVQPWDVRA